VYNVDGSAGLGQHRLMPPGDYAQEKALKQEEKLIGQLESLELTNDLIKVLRDQVLWLLDGTCQHTVCSFEIVIDHV